MVAAISTEGFSEIFVGGEKVEWVGSPKQKSHHTTQIMAIFGGFYEFFVGFFITS